jgi:predicted glycoside hydrolase/deacetylase ChbG (UPF0249 family)
VRRTLIVNADDLGLSEGVNCGVLRAHDEGIVSSASLMVRAPAAAHAAEELRLRPRLGVGLHVDLGEWVHVDGEWRTVYEVVDGDDAAGVAAEVAGQVERFRALLGRDPDHLDSHQHVHQREPARSALLAIARSLRVALRGLDPVVRHCGAFHGQTGTGDPLPEAISVDALVRLLRGLPAGATELGCHPGLDPDLASPYREERAREVEALCDARVRHVVAEEGIELACFAGLAGRRHSHYAGN